MNTLISKIRLTKSSTTRVSDNFTKFVKKIKERNHSSTGNRGIRVVSDRRLIV